MRPRALSLKFFEYLKAIVTGGKTRSISQEKNNTIREMDKKN